MRVFWVPAAITILAVAALFAIGCYPTPPVDPPSCVQDPTQDWCVPPPFSSTQRPACWPVKRREGIRAVACDEGAAAPEDVDLVVDRTGKTWSPCAWNRTNGGSR